ncbi:VOC family protein [Maribacter sp. TH_r10]|uniref:VOC family protein n=1 Tax=Maribacter luteus TaxID=2594478 RepID=A0A6I2MT95_9FLAO|nr:MULTISPECIES: VOC family protein [Maribacter]MDV7138551.1 VOC family protein [Maribacter sp. TH_r10]MRX66077.1 VOC family protein [Maribacter luteus]
MEYNSVGWFEIPVVDMERAKVFYETVFDITISVHDLGGLIMGWFPSAEGKKGASGSLVQHQMYIPSATHGPLLYFTCVDLAIELSRVVAAKGEILKEKTEIGGGHGFMALVKDTEGNRIALHSLR